jgi:hypothetical protein
LCQHAQRRWLDKSVKSTAAIEDQLSVPLERKIYPEVRESRWRVFTLRAQLAVDDATGRILARVS